MTSAVRNDLAYPLRGWMVYWQIGQGRCLDETNDTVTLSNLFPIFDWTLQLGCIRFICHVYDISEGTKPYQSDKYGYVDAVLNMAPCESSHRPHCICFSDHFRPCIVIWSHRIPLSCLLYSDVYCLYIAQLKGVLSMFSADFNIFVNHSPPFGWKSPANTSPLLHFSDVSSHKCIPLIPRFFFVISSPYS